MERSRLLMLVGLVVLALVVGDFDSFFNMRGMRGVLPWVIFAFVIYAMFGKGGCCGSKRGDEAEE